MDNFKSVNTKNIPTIVFTQTTQTPEPRHWNDIESQMSSPTGILFQKTVTATEKFRKLETRNLLIPFLKNSRNGHNQTEEKNIHTKTSCIRDDISPPLTKTTPEIEEMLVGDENAEEFHATVIHCGWWKLYVTLDFQNYKLLDNLLD